MKQILQLCALLSCIAPWSLHASLVFQGVVNFQGSGLGSALTSLTFQDNGTESGCVAFIGGVDVIGSCEGASVIAQTSIAGPVADYSDLAVVFQPQGGPVTLDSAVLTISANGHTFSSTGVTGCPNNNCNLAPVADGSGYVVHLDNSQAARALATLGPLTAGTSASVALATVASAAGKASLGVSVTNTAVSSFTGQVTVGDAAVPEPGTFALFSGAALLLIPLSRLCFEGPDDLLKMTENTQPALLTVSVAALAVLREQGWKPDYVAGHSLGEYSALVAANSLQFADALRLVRNRGRYMQEAVPEGVGAMAALVKMPLEKLELVLEQAAEGEIVSAANFNSPDQVVIAGHAGAVNRAAQLAKTAGAKRALLLPVSAPFHCALMRPAQERLRRDLDATEFRDLDAPLVNNWHAREVHTGAEAREGLYQQVPNPVRWAESMRYLASREVTRCVEVGAGSILTGLLRNTEPSIAGLKFGEPSDLDKLVA